MTARHGDGISIVAKQSLRSRADLKQAIDVDFEIFDDTGQIGSNLNQSLDGTFKLSDKSLLAFGQPNQSANTRFKSYERLTTKAEESDLQDQAVLAALGIAMSHDEGSRPERLSGIPAGYTYIGQFIAHDISRFFQPVLGTLQNNRSAALDLDSVFGKADTTAKSVATHTIGGLSLGHTNSPYATGRVPDDIPRSRKGEPVLPDSRNDAHLALSQTHVAVIKFHHAVCKKYPRLSPEKQRAVTTQHFQYAVLHDYLPRLIQKEIYSDVMRNGRAVFEAGRRIDPNKFQIPIEFAAAAFRFGHSLVRGDYTPWNECRPKLPTSVGDFWSNSYLGGGEREGDNNLDGGKLRNTWVSDWQILIDFSGTPLAKFQTRAPLIASAIDTAIALPLAAIPKVQFPTTGLKGPWTVANLASRTLVRGRSLGIADAFTVHREINDMLVTAGRTPLAVLSADQLINGENEFVQHSFQQNVGELMKKPPLWYYVLKEASHNARSFGAGRRVGPLASLIVMETIHAAIDADKNSWLHRPDIMNNHPMAGECFRGFADFLCVGLENKFPDNVC